MEKPDIKKIVDVIKELKNILIIPHINPDGDTLGSALALFFAFKKINKNATVISPDLIPKMLRFLPGVDSIIINPEIKDEEYNDFDALITVECPNLERIGSL